MAITYGIVASIQTYLAVSADVTWAAIIATACGFASMLCGVAAWRATEDDGPLDASTAFDRDASTNRAIT
ncbi:hypothetical protein ACFWY9_10375 [Amycolatopsis sp. NPDC059027]|uniref:hypothetical protein n=1 Tax=Amycolatopsis sp. NPDC059027 TaxID=3346709 RepID=UPI00366B0575